MESPKAKTLSLRHRGAATTPRWGCWVPLPAAAGSRGVPTATLNQRGEHRAAILARGHCACADRLQTAGPVASSGGPEREHCARAAVYGSLYSEPRTYEG